MIEIQHIDKDSPHLSSIKELFGEYLAELNEDLCFQHFDEEINNPLLKYAPPQGSLILALWNNEPAGCVALQLMAEKGICEMKRLYVRPAFRMHGIGDTLVQHILSDAAALGYHKMVLDTLSRLTTAIRLYERYGFAHTSAYYINPLPNVVYMEKDLSFSK